MSINKIVDYVRQTPGNTNPSVVESMVKSEMNGTLEKAKEYTDNAFRELGVNKTIKTISSGYMKKEEGDISSTAAVEGHLLEVGKTYRLTLDSGCYTSVAKLVNVEEFGEVIYIGNGADIDGINTGDSYVAYCITINDLKATYFADLNLGAKYTLEVEATTPIKLEYLPDLTGKAGTVKLKKTVILPETTAENSGNGMYAFPYVNLTIGETYMAKFNGEVYRTECFEIDGDIAIGNRAEVNDGISTGEPFVYVLAENGEYAVGMVFNPDTFEPLPYESVTLEIYQEIEVAIPIEQKFLPSMCLPVVEVYTAIPVAQKTEQVEAAVLTKEECDQLNNLFGTPFYVLIAFCEEVNGSGNEYSIGGFASSSTAYLAEFDAEINIITVNASNVTVYFTFNGEQCNALARVN